MNGATSAISSHGDGFGRRGALGSALGGAVGGGLGGAFARCLEEITPPAWDTALAGGLTGAAVWGAAAALAGILVGRLLGRLRGARAAGAGAIFAGFWSSAAAAIEADQAGAASAARLFALGVVALTALWAALPWLRRVAWRARWFVVAWLLVCLAGEIHNRLFPKVFTPLDPPPDEAVVLLQAAPLPAPLGVVAAHQSFLTFDPDEGRWHRWELWQFPDRGGTSWGHVHRDLLRLESGVGGGPGWRRSEWRGDEARALLAALHKSSEYPYRHRYFAWPGPNSNTYIAWVFREAGVGHDIDPRGLGQDYLGRVGAGVTTTGTGVQVESPLLGLKAGWKDGVEVHFAGFVFGVDVWPPALKTPFGRFGFAE